MSQLAGLFFLGSFLSESFFPIFSMFGLRNFLIFQIFLIFFSKYIYVKLTNLIFYPLENFTNSDRTPPYLGTNLQLFPKFGNSGEKLSLFPTRYKITTINNRSDKRASPTQNTLSSANYRM